MKKLLLSFLAFTTIGTVAFAQKIINDANAEKRSVGSFHGIDVGTGIELLLTEGSTEDVAVSADKTEFRDKIVTKVENGILKIYYQPKTGAINTKKESKNLKAYVSYKSLDKLDANSGAQVKISGVLKSSSLEMKVNTGASLDAKVDIADLKIDQNTGSRVTLSGKADKLDVDGNTGSRFKGEDMATSNCNVTVSTGAVVSVNAEKELVAKANTGGSVKYKGNAAIKEIKTHTGGSVSKI